MNVFDIVGPIMVGPSSSHTAGAVKIGRVARELLGGEPESVVIGFHGSFAQTCRGHGTDKAVIAGLMGMSIDDVRIRDSLGIAQAAGMKFKFEKITIRDAHPNTVRIKADRKNEQQILLQGASIGGGNIIIQKVNGLNVEFTGQYNTLIISHTDTPGAVAQVTNLLSCNYINIANMKVYRSCRGGDATMVIETDEDTGEELFVLIQQLSRVKNCMRINIA